MQDRQLIEDLLNSLGNPDYHEHIKKGVVDSDGVRITEQTIDSTFIDDNSSPKTDRTQLHSMLDCGHSSSHGLAGRCRFCDAFVCGQCLFFCSSCGHPVCLACSSLANFGSNELRYCRLCIPRLRREKTVRKIKKALLSFFFEE